MRLVIERDGGFTVIESDDVQDLNVRSDGVDIVRRDGASVRLEREDHAASVALATAIALRCGVMVEPLAEQSEVDSEEVMHDATAALVRERSKPWVSAAESVREHFRAVEAWAGATSVPPKPASESVSGEPPRSLGQWVAGEPPKGVLWYVVARAGAFGCVAWDGLRFRDWYSGTVLMGADVAHLPTPLPSRR
jgi:hypothetical protein